MALYARTLLNRDTLRAFSFSLSLSFLFSLTHSLTLSPPSSSLPLPLLPYVAIPHSPLHLAFTDTSFPPRCTTTLVSSFSNFPRWRYRPLCFFLDTVKRLNATTSPLRFLPHFFALSCEVWYAVMARYAVATDNREKEKSFSVFSSLLSNRWLCANHIRMKILQVNDRLIRKAPTIVLIHDIPESQQHLANHIIKSKIYLYQVFNVLIYDLILSE